MDQPLQPVEPVTRERVNMRTAAVLCSIFFGASVTEAVSVNVLPRTLDLFTSNPSWIFWILAINPAFGFIAQPLVGLISDHVWTPIGRRAVFLVASAPIVAAALLCIPWLGSLSLIVIAVVVLQFFQDVINGSDQPLLADLISPEQRTFVLGLTKAAENTGFLLVLFVGMPALQFFKDSYDERLFGLPLYAFAAICQIVFVAGAAFFLGEKPIERMERPRLSVARYFHDFYDQPMLPRIAVAYFLRAFARTAVVGSASLYAFRTLQLSDSEFGWSWGLMPFMALTLGVPLGLMVEKHAKHRVLQFSFLLLIAACVIGYFGQGMTGLLLAAMVFGTADILLEVTHKAYMSDHYPADLIGQLAGAVNCFYATGRTAALVLIGWSVHLTNPGVDWETIGADAVINYRVIWIVSSVAAVIAIGLLATTRDLRHERRLHATTPDPAEPTPKT